MELGGMSFMKGRAHAYRTIRCGDIDRRRHVGKSASRSRHQ
jgi:hypothetical protein